MNSDINDAKIPLFSFQTLGNCGKITEISFVKILFDEWLKEEFCFL